MSRLRPDAPLPAAAKPPLAMKKGPLAETCHRRPQRRMASRGLKQSCDPAYEPMQDMEDVDYDDQDVGDPENFDEGA